MDYYEDDEFIKRKSNCTVFLGYTSNMVSSGLRETIRFLVQHKMVWHRNSSQLSYQMCIALTDRLHRSHSRWCRGRFHQVSGSNVFGLIRIERKGFAGQGDQSHWEPFSSE